MSTNDALGTLRQLYHALKEVYPRCTKLPDNASVCRPPAATLTIRTPGFSATKHGNAERPSSPVDELSACCFADDTRLRFAPSSTPLVSIPGAAPTLDLEPWG